MDIFAKPLGALLRMIFDFVTNIGLETEYISAYAIAIILTTIIFKLILLPLGIKQSKSMKKMQDIQPKVKEIQEKYKNDPQKQQAKTMELYKEHNANPFGSCLPLLIQMPILIGFFRVLRNPAPIFEAGEMISKGYVFQDATLYEQLNKSFLWISNLKDPDPVLWGLPLLAAITTFLQSRIMSSKSAGGDEKAQQTQKTMNMVFPVLILIMSRSFPAGLALYWVIGNIFTIVQQLITNRTMGGVKEESS
ncbi:MAG: YidC/Oxa1 family membrane protein insertase [Firmicutes bacterium]|nr:YidC/Oxa1 family membrane protein insertase [Bacillota bacterium]